MPKLLLVEDDNNLREIYEARLQAEGYSIVSAKDGEEALVVAKAEKPDLIVSDVMMPKISGFEMLDILRNTPELRATKVIMLTALGQAEDQSRANRLGADRYLVKSQVTLEDIVKVAHELLGDNAGEVIQPQNQAPITPTEQTSPVTPEPEPTTAAVPVAPTPTVANAPIPPAPEPPEPAPIPTPVPPPSAPTGPTTAAAPSVLSPLSESEQPNPAPDISIDASGQLSQAGTEQSDQTDQQVNTFLNSVTPTPTPPQAQPVMSPDPDQVANDQTLTQAVNDLMGPGSVSTATTAPAPSASSANPSPAGSVPVNGKKVIKPLDEPPRSNLEDLVAKEEIMESAQAQPAPSTDKPFNPSDPNNIAL